MPGKGQPEDRKVESAVEEVSGRVSFRVGRAQARCGGKETPRVVS